MLLPQADRLTATCALQLATWLSKLLRNVQTTSSNSLPGFKNPQPWPIASAASLKGAALKKAGSEAAHPPRSDSLPEVALHKRKKNLLLLHQLFEIHATVSDALNMQVFKRLLASGRQSPLGVRMSKEDGSPSTKKASKPRGSPFKRHIPGHRVTLLQPPPSL